jgi:hypothetical protein
VSSKPIKPSIYQQSFFFLFDVLISKGMQTQEQELGQYLSGYLSI